MDEVWSWLVSMLVGVIIAVLTLEGIGVFEIHTEALKHKKACESHLPRNETCSMKYLPTKDYPRIIR